MIETHPFTTFIPPKVKTIILGSFPCKKNGSYGDWYYSGSGRNDLWNLLSDVYDMPTENREQKEKLCKKNGIAISDIALKINRKKKNCSDSNLEIIEFNNKGINACLNKGVKQILCTSKFVYNQLNKHFPDTKVKTVALPSPSPSVNRYLATLDEYKGLKKKGVGYYDYKLMKYKEALL